MNYLRGYYTAVLKPNFFSRPVVHPLVKKGFYGIAGASVVFVILSEIERVTLASKTALRKSRMEMVILKLHSLCMSSKVQSWLILHGLMEILTNGFTDPSRFAADQYIGRK